MSMAIYHFISGETHHVRNTVRDGIYMAAIWTYHLSFFDMHLSQARSETQRRSIQLNFEKPQEVHGATFSVVHHPSSRAVHLVTMYRQATNNSMRSRTQNPSCDAHPLRGIHQGLPLNLRQQSPDKFGIEICIALLNPCVFKL